MILSTTVLSDCAQGRLRVGKQTYAFFLPILLGFKWGEYAYLGVDDTSSGAWDSHVKDVCVNGIKKLNQLHSNRDINLCTRR